MEEKSKLFNSKTTVKLKTKITNRKEFEELAEKLKKEVAQVENTIEQLQNFEFNVELETST